LEGPQIAEKLRRARLTALSQVRKGLRK
jgi:hypothetical protein